MIRTALLALLVGCGSDAKTIDAATAPIDTARGDAPATDARGIDATLVDAPPPTVFTVDCATVTPTATVTTVGFSFSPMATTIAVDQVVEFTMPPEHDVIPDPSVPTDSGLHAGFDASTCLRFTVAGTFGFKCQPHQFKGSITVTP